MTLRDKLKSDLKARALHLNAIYADEAQDQPSILDLSRIYGQVMLSPINPCLPLHSPLPSNRLTGLTTYTPDQFMTITRINS